MIPKDLKIGETFEEDGRTYWITKVCENDTYESTAIKDEEELKCQYCGKVCKNALGLASHEKTCKAKIEE